MVDGFKIIDESDLPAAAEKYKCGRWAELHKILDTLPSGKWVEVPVPEHVQSASYLGTCIQQTIRLGRKPYKIKVRTIRSERRLFITTVPIDGASK